MIRYSLFVSIAFILCIGNAQAQKKKGGSGGNFILGMRGGINFTQPMVINRFAVLSFTDAQSTDKTYNPLWENMGFQTAFVAMYKLPAGLFVSVQPTYATYNYRYENLFIWMDSQDPNNQLMLTLRHRHRLQYFEFPLLVKKEFGSGIVRPYLQGGAFYGMLLNADQSVETEEVVGSLAGNNQMNVGERNAGISPLYIRTHFAATGGVGVGFIFNSLQITLDANYQYGLHNVTNEINRYNTVNLAGATYDIPDDVRLTAFTANLGILVPVGGGGGGKGRAGGAVPCPAF